MKNSKVFFRVDGNAQIGLGHLVRCLALAQMLQKEFDITFVCKEIPKSIVNEIHALRLALLMIKGEDDFLRLLKSNAIVVLDHYGLDSAYQKSIKNTGCKLVCIDDMHDKAFFADVIINHAPGITAADYKARAYTRFALGLDYVLLRPVFLEKAKQPRILQSIKKVFVCFGGADNKNLTQRVADILKADQRFKQIIIVAGSAYQHLNSLQLAIENDRFKLYHSIGPEKMADLLFQSELAIVPASGILQEAIALKCNVISGMYVDNQRNLFEKYKNLNAFTSAGDFSKEYIIAAIDSVFENKHDENTLIDGKSAVRLLNIFKLLVKEDRVNIRKLKETDLHKTFEWANNNEIRRFSFNADPIPFEMHKAWFESKLYDGNCFYFIGEADGNQFGSVRFDVTANQAKISYLVDPAFQNSGLGTILLKKGVDLLMQLNNDISTVWGEVFYENVSSQKIFQKLGYTAEANKSDFLKYIKNVDR